MAFLEPNLFSVLTPEGAPNPTTTQQRLESLRRQMPPEMQTQLDQRMPIGPQQPVQPTPVSSPAAAAPASPVAPAAPAADPLQATIQQAQQMFGPKITQQLIKEATNLEPPKLLGPDVFGRGGIMGTGMEPLDVLAFAIGAGVTSNLPQNQAMQRTMEIAQLPNLFKQNQRKSAREFMESVGKAADTQRSQVQLQMDVLKQQQAQAKEAAQREIIDEIARSGPNIDSRLLLRAAAMGIGGLSLKDLLDVRSGTKQLVERDDGTYLVDKQTGIAKQVMVPTLVETPETAPTIETEPGDFPVGAVPTGEMIEQLVGRPLPGKSASTTSFGADREAEAAARGFASFRQAPAEVQREINDLVKQRTPGRVAETAGAVLQPEQIQRLDALRLTQPQLENVIGIYTGLLPPLMGSRAQSSKDGQAISAGLSALKYDSVKAVQDFTEMQRRISSMNSVQQIRLRQSIESLGGVPDHPDPLVRNGSVGQAEKLFAEWKATGLPGGFRVYNKAALNAAAELPGESGAVARTLISHIEDMANELSVIYRQGNTPTDQALQSARLSLQADWNEAQFKKNIDLIKQNIKIRQNSINAMRRAEREPNIYRSETRRSPGAAPQQQRPSSQSGVPAGSVSGTLSDGRKVWKTPDGTYLPR